MRKQGFLRLILSWVLFLGMALPTVVAGQTAPAAERQKIESLIKHVGELKDAKFIRNGSTHDVSTAVSFLRGKWEANDADVKTAKDFIDKVASASGTSGKPYLIRFKDGRETKSRDFLLAELKKIES
jgi:cation diffusion facilitator CzcD-associated flavoprotein CzcO